MCLCGRPRSSHGPPRAWTCSRGAGSTWLWARADSGCDRGDGRTAAVPGRSFEALDEAIDVIRGIWEVEERSPLRVEGDYYTVREPKRGPAPAHDIPIRIGAYKPRILRLTGRKPRVASLAGLSEARRPAGRQPGDRRGAIGVVEIPPRSGGGRHLRQVRATSRDAGRAATAWVDDLLQLTIDDGVSTFILTATTQTMRPFADVRDVAASGGGRPGAGRTRVCRLLRRARRDGAAAGGDRLRRDARRARRNRRGAGRLGYSRLRNTYMRGGEPGLVLRVTASRRSSMRSRLPATTKTWRCRSAVAATASADDRRKTVTS